MENKKDILKTVTRLAQSGEWEKVIKEYLKLLEMEPNEISLHNSIADAYSKLGQDRKAFEHYLKVLDSYQKTDNQAKLGFLNKKIAKLDPKKFDLEGKALHEKLSKIVGAQSTYDTGNIEDAIPALKEAAKQDKNNVDVWLKLGDANEKKMVIGDAVEAYINALRLQLTHNNFTEAADTAKKILNIDKGNIEATAVTAEELFKSGKKEEAEEMFKEVLINLADKNMTAVGIEASKRAMNAGIPYGKQFYAYFLFKDNKAEEAKKILEAGNDLSQEEKLLLGKIYFKTAEYARAKDILLSMDHEIVEGSEEILEQIADVYLKLTEYRKAAEFYLKSMKLLFAAGAMDAAMNMSSKIKNVDAENTEMHEMLAKIYAKKGMKNQLIEEYTKLAAIYEKTDKKAEALKVRQMLEKIKMI